MNRTNQAPTPAPSTDKAEREPASHRIHAGALPLAVETLSGAMAGAVAGSIAGPVGAIAGAALGGVIAAAAGEVIERDGEARRAHDAELDEAIGMVGGRIGEASPDQPPSRHGLFSRAAMGGGGGGGPDSVGPIQNADD